MPNINMCTVNKLGVQSVAVAVSKGEKYGRVVGGGSIIPVCDGPTCENGRATAFLHY